MSTLTTNLSLEKPAFNEYFDSWHDVANANYDLIDAAVGTLQALTLGAAGVASPLTINQRFLDVEGSVALVQALTDIDDGWTEDIPLANTFVGPDDAVLGMGDAGKIIGSFGLQLAELSGVEATLNATAGIAARLGRVTQGILTAGGADLIAIGTPPSGLKVDPAADFEILVNGEYAIIRSEVPEQQLPATLPANSVRYYLVAESVAWDDQAGGAADGAASGSTFTGTFTDGAGSARPGDLLDITAGAGADAIFGQYVIKTMGAGTLTINGTFPSNLSSLTFQFRRRHWPTLSLQKWGVEIDSIINGQAYWTATSTLVGTVLGHATMQAAGLAEFNMATDPATQYSPGLSYDSGWVPAAGFFDGNNLDAVDVGASIETYTTALPEVPSSYQLLWSALADAGANAIPVPLEANGNAFGVRQFWNQNVLSVLAGISTDVLQYTNGAPMSLAMVNAGFFRLIAKG